MNWEATNKARFTLTTKKRITQGLKYQKKDQCQMVIYGITIGNLVQILQGLHGKGTSKSDMIFAEHIGINQCLKPWNNKTIWGKRKIKTFSLQAL